MDNTDECPVCHSKMNEGLAAFTFHGTLLGSFDAYICSACGKTLFTETGARQIIETKIV